MPATFTELLPKHLSHKSPAMRWVPVDEPSGPRIGLLHLDTARETTSYVVEQFPSDTGFGIALLKLSRGSDATESHYCLDVRRDGKVECECKGYVAHGHCKHADAVAACLANGWL